MSEVSSSANEKTGSTKKPVSPVRNIIGFIVLIGVLIVCWFEYSALIGFRRAVSALEARAQDENQTLLTGAEAERLLGKAPDGPATEFTDRSRTFAKTTYTWSGLIKHYTLTAYYTNEKDSRLHHYETEGSKYESEPSILDTTSSPPPSKSSRPPSTRPALKKTRKSGTAPGSPPTVAPDSKDLPTGASEKGRTPELEPSGKPETGGKPAEPGDKGSSPKSATTPDQTKPPQ